MLDDFSIDDKKLTDNKKHPLHSHRKNSHTPSHYMDVSATKFHIRKATGESDSSRSFISNPRKRSIQIKDDTGGTNSYS